MPEKTHTHGYRGVTVYVDGHLHLFCGITSPAQLVSGHTHTIMGNTTSNCWHSHDYSFATQAPTYIDKTGCGHFHYYNGKTEAEGRCHLMSGMTLVAGD